MPAVVVRGRLRDPSQAPAEGEELDRLLSVGGVVVEQILSASSSTPSHYRQQHDEWVVVLSGGATLDVDGERCTLVSGEWILLPAGVRHSVLRTEARTSWLAVHVHRE